MKKHAYWNWTLAMAICLVFSVIFSVVTLASEKEKAYNWFVRHNDTHTQPITDATQRLVERYNGYHIDKKHGDGCEEKVLYLTFDAGYENGNVEKIMDVLSEEGVPAAFFVLKRIILNNPELVKRMEAEGHLVCNHTMSHPDTTTLSREAFEKEVNGLADLYRNCTGNEIAPYYRPPEGRYNEKTLQYAKELGYKTVFWSMAYADWDNDKQPDPEKAKEKLLSRTHNGAVILLHPTSATNAEIMRDLIREWKALGYRFGTLDELTSA